MKRNRDPKKGTGKKPKGSGRRLYTDESYLDPLITFNNLYSEGLNEED